MADQNPLKQLLSAVAVIAAVVICLTSDPASAYNALGHRVVAIIAERNLTPTARAEVTRLLALEKRTSLAEVSSWADEVRDLKVPRQPSHSIRLLPVDNADDEKKFCDDGSCVTGAIINDIRTLKDHDARDEAKLLALKYLTHFVGDLHQPLHAAAGGRDVVLDGRKRSLHGIWDATIINSLHLKDDEIADIAEQRHAGSSYSGDQDVEAWALEGRAIVQQQILPETGGYKPGWKKEDIITPVLPHEYPKMKQAVVLERLGAAGSRLAAVLNQIYQ